MKTRRKLVRVSNSVLPMCKKIVLSDTIEKNVWQTRVGLLKIKASITWNLVLTSQIRRKRRKIKIWAKVIKRSLLFLFSRKLCWVRDGSTTCIQLLPDEIEIFFELRCIAGAHRRPILHIKRNGNDFLHTAGPPGENQHLIGHTDGFRQIVSH